MANSSAPDRIRGLADLAPRYQALLCDVWGVLHNGVAAFEPARSALKAYRAAGGVVVLITNAPRTSDFVIDMIADIGVEAACYDAIVTSGDVTRELLAGYGAASLYHIGLERDLTLYEGLPLRSVAAAEAEIICCTSLRDDLHETPEDYDAELAPLAARGLTMICANPDIVVERGHRLAYCAGAIAERYQRLGGRTEIAGKPHRPIYEAALAQASAIAGRPIAKASVLAIGDGAPTDLAGACRQDIDVLFVTGGIHAGHFGAVDQPDAAAVHRFLDTEGLGATAFLPGLAW